MGLVGLLLVLVGFIGVVIGYIRIAIHAYREQSPMWGFLCLLVPNANLVWGLVYWGDDEARPVFVRYLGCVGIFVLGFILTKWANS